LRFLIKAINQLKIIMEKFSGEFSGEKFLKGKYNDIPVNKENPVSQEERIAEFLKVIEQTHGYHKDPKVFERLKKSYHREYVIKPEDVPESYFENQQRLARERGHGDIEITEELRKQAIEVIVRDQESTFDNWVDYLCSSDAPYPTWAKYWVFRSILNLSTFDKEKKAFAKRRKDTVAPFPDLDREALSCVMDIIVKKVGREEISGERENAELQKIIQGENFGKLYAYAIEKVTPAEQNELLTTEGQWVKYCQNPGEETLKRLVGSLQGHGTGWCTAGEETARAQLKGGEFYVYYSNDKDGKPTVPRVAIRMENGKIAEVRGIAPEQNLDPYINDVVKEKLEEFPDKKDYEKKISDMKRLTEVDRKTKEKEELTEEDLRFLYELDEKIKGFGYEKDPRIEEILADRDIKSDLAEVTGYSKEEISTTREEFLKGGSKFHYSDLDLSGLKSAEGLVLPETMNGNLYLSGLKSAEKEKIRKKYPQLKIV